MVEEIEDAGYSGAYLERPGLDRARALVRSGAADAVAVLFRDRIARGVYTQLLAEEFRQHEARLVALNSRSDDSPDGELGDNILDVIAAWERKKIAEKMNRGKRRKAKEGKVIAGPSPDYGFRYNENRDGYIVDEKKISIVRRIFRMVGVEGATLSTVRRTLQQEGLLAPSGRKGVEQPVPTDAYKRRCVPVTYLRGSSPPRINRSGGLPRSVAKLRCVVVRQDVSHLRAETLDRSRRCASLRENEEKRPDSETGVDSGTGHRMPTSRRSGFWPHVMR